MKVFIADDSPILRERLDAMLSELPGIKIVGQAGNVADAIETIRALHPDVVILDIRMPGGSGIGVGTSTSLFVTVLPSGDRCSDAP